MILAIYTLIWLAVWLISCVISYFAGRLPVVNYSRLPWVVHRGWVPDPARDRKRSVRPFRWPAA